MFGLFSLKKWINKVVRWMSGTDAIPTFIKTGGYGVPYSLSGGSSGVTNASLLQTFFNNNKDNIRRNVLIPVYSSAYGNGSLAMGYFLQGFNNNPYGGFFVAHYDSPKYVGIANGTFREHVIITNQNMKSLIPIARGYVSIKPSAANTPTSVTISFGRTFSAAPTVVVTPVTSVPGKTVTGVGVTEVSTTGAKIWLTRTNTGATTVNWIAIGI